MAGYIPRVASEQTRIESLEREFQILQAIERDISLSKKARAKLPPQRREMLRQFELEGRLL